MKANWKPVVTDQPGTTRYQRSSPRAQAEIHRQDHALTAEMKTGIFGLGTHIGSCFMDTSLSDEVVLSRLDDSLHPPRFGNWKAVDDQEAAGVTHYRGQKTDGGHTKVDAYISRGGEEAQVVAQVGHFGTHIEGAFFAPAPSDQEILKRISRE